MKKENKKQPPKVKQGVEKPSKKKAKPTIKNKTKNIAKKKVASSVKKVKKEKLNKVSKTAKTLKIRFLGGVGEIGKNMTALEYGGDIIVIDAGLTFPGGNMPGVDLVIPDVSFLEQNKNKIKGVIITHGHEDHIGALPYTVKEMGAPVYGTKLTLTLIENKLRIGTTISLFDALLHAICPGN